MEWNFVFLGLVILATILTFSTLIYAIILGFQVSEAGIGRILFGSLVSLKVWVAIILAWSVAMVFFPQMFAPWSRVFFRWFLVVYIVSQSGGTLVALERWRRE